MSINCHTASNSFNFLASVLCFSAQIFQVSRLWLLVHSGSECLLGLTAGKSQNVQVDFLGLALLVFSPLLSIYSTPDNT